MDLSLPSPNKLECDIQQMVYQFPIDATLAKRTHVDQHKTIHRNKTEIPNDMLQFQNRITENNLGILENRIIGLIYGKEKQTDLADVDIVSWWKH